MRPFAKIVNGFQPLNIFAKSSSLDVWLGCEYATEYVCQSAVNQIVTKPLKYTSSIVIDAFLGDMSDRGSDTAQKLKSAKCTFSPMDIYRENWFIR